MYLVDNKNHDWVYLDRQRPEEVTIFKNFDSDEDAEARSKSPGLIERYSTLLRQNSGTPRRYRR